MFQFFFTLAAAAAAAFASPYSPHYQSAGPYPELKYTITKTWDNRSSGTHIDVSFQLVETYHTHGRGLVLKFEAPYLNDPLIADNVPTHAPFLGLWNYEVVEAFFLGSHEEEYLEIELGPKGHYLLLLLKGPNNLATYQLPLTNYTASCSTVSGRWLGEAYIPGEYFPCNVTRFNAFGIHGSGPRRVHMALWPVGEGTYDAPDFHRLSAFQPISFPVELNRKCDGGIRSIVAAAAPTEGGASKTDKLPEIVES